MARKTTAIFLLVVFAFLLSGCATTRKRKDMEIQGLRNQITALEAQIQSKDQEIIRLRDALGKTIEEKGMLVRETSKKKVIGEVKSRPNARQIQTALKNAGYYLGAIDGRKGRQTQDAIRQFQKANNLPVDGRVGKQTWNLLKEYLYKKVK